MSNDVERGRKIWQWGFKRKAATAHYRALGAPADVDILFFARGLKDEDLFAGAFQEDIMIVVDAEEFAAKVAPRPRRLDRIRLGSTSYAIEQVRGSPEGQEIFFKLLLRGGQQ